MYYSFFLIYLIFGFTITLCIFLWAIKNGQFRDQQRARFLPLEDEEGRHAASASTFHRYQAYTLFGLIVFGLLACAFGLAYVLLS